MLYFITIFLLFSFSSLAYASCVMLDLSTWTSEQRGKLSHVVVTIVNETVTEQHLPEQNVQVCAPTADLSGLNSVTLQNSAQAIVDRQATASTNRQTQRTAAEGRVRSNNLCAASFTEIEERIEAERLAIRTAITNSGTVAALKDATRDGMDKYAVILTKALECVLGRAKLQGQEN